MDLVRAVTVRDALADSGIDALICRLPENVLFLTGYWPRNGFSFVVFPREGEPTLIVPEGEVDWASASGIADVRTFGWGQVKDRDPYGTIGKHLEAVRSLRGKTKIGFEASFEVVAVSHMPGDVQTCSDVTRQLLKDSLPLATLIDATGTLNSLRAIKTEYEIEKIAIANEVACLGLQAFRDHMRPGLTEVQVAAAVQAAIHVGGVGYKGAASAWGFPEVMSGLNTSVAHRPYLISTTKPLQEGDLVMIELAVVVDGYWSDLTRTYVVGTPTDRQREVWDAVHGAQQAAIAALKSGAGEGEVDAAARQLLAQRGLGAHFIHHTGHGLGFRYHEPIPFLHPAARGTLAEGMITSVEPGVYIEGWGGLRIEDNAVVRPTGGQVLSVFDTGLAG